MIVVAHPMRTELSYAPRFHKTMSMHYALLPAAAAYRERTDQDHR